ncbi:hypothetical protein [Spirosoma endbachense]|uniref:Uncharacterized protein n=1 Tax=Spirosoma endbachense TaxID=2666025 RepID=A0A6P1VYM3_9BACT|nr:hypothetical protein [Spirosoma endbachense]QHV97875.1 hypothetical protein GJR95_23975 [Spirosoma endbachense]
MENQPADEPLLYRWSKWMDGNGKLWVVTALGGYFKMPSTPKATVVELYDADSECVQDFPYNEVMSWIRQGTLKRVEGPILL